MCADTGLPYTYLEFCHWVCYDVLAKYKFSRPALNYFGESHGKTVVVVCFDIFQDCQVMQNKAKKLILQMKKCHNRCVQQSFLNVLK